MMLKNLTIRTLTPRSFLAALLCLGLGGCGCTSDSTPRIPQNPIRLPAVLGLKTQMPPIPVAPPRLNVPVRIDVAFVMDDSDGMNDKPLGIIPANQGDRRERSQAAQAIMRRIENMVRARLEAEYQNAQLPVPPLDFAFAVARYEDFGGAFTSPLRRTGAVDDPANRNNDQDARPFILNMPILRKAHPQFDERFLAAMAREAPGDGNPYVNLPGTPDLFKVLDPQSGIEALYQIAAPQNANLSYGGFDGNANNSTLDSGLPTSQDGLRNPQTLPGASGDVPAVGFQAVNPTDGDYDDPDGRPLFRITDEGGNVVMIPATGGAGGTVPSVSSGNIGGIGWRPDAARFVILATDIGTVTPTATPPIGTPELPGLLPPPAQSEMVGSTAGAPDAPRQARNVLLGAFDSGVQTLTGGFPLTTRRLGTANGPDFDTNPTDNVRAPGDGVAPVGAHTVEETIARLNALDIEVLLIGAPFIGGLDTKPGVTGVNGDIDSDIPASQFDPSDPSKVQPDMAPWFWMNAVSRLTTPEVTSIALGGAQETFPGVYNFGTVWPFNPADPQGADESNVRDSVTDDLVERIRDWIDNGFVSGGSSIVPLAQRPALPTLSYQFVLTLADGPQDPDVIQTAPLQAATPQTTFTTTATIPTYWSDQTAPADQTVSFPSAQEGPLQYNAKDDAVALPATRNVPYKIDAALTMVNGAVAGNAAQVQAILAFLKARGDGTNPIASEFDSINVTDAAFTVFVRDALFPDFGAQLATVVRGCAILNDLTVNQDASDQVGGTCPFPPVPAPVAVP